MFLCVSSSSIAQHPSEKPRLIPFEFQVLSSSYLAVVSSNGKFWCQAIEIVCVALWSTRIARRVTADTGAPPSCSGSQWSTPGGPSSWPAMLQVAASRLRPVGRPCLRSYLRGTDARRHKSRAIYQGSASEWHFLQKYPPHILICAVRSGTQRD